jgi:hypothetical protein
MEAEFLTRIAAYDGSEGAAYPLGRWVAIARPELQQAASPEVVTAAETIERTYYMAGDGDVPMSALVAVLLDAQATLTA